MALQQYQNHERDMLERLLNNMDTLVFTPRSLAEWLEKCQMWGVDPMPHIRTALAEYLDGRRSAPEK